MKVQEMIDNLINMPKDAELKIVVNAYYYNGDDFDPVEEPSLNKDGTVTIGTVWANP